MKKVLVLLILLTFMVPVFSQANISVNVDDDIYYVLDYAQIKGYCSILPGNKPYARSIVLDAIDQILQHSDKLTETEIEVLENFVKKCEFENNKKNNPLHLRFNNQTDDQTPVHFMYDYSTDTEISGGIYNNSKFNAVSFDVLPRIKFQGDLLNNYSFMIEGKFDLAQTPLVYLGAYDIGKDWYSVPEQQKIRKVKTYYNSAYLPYSYEKKWDGAIYYIKNMSSDGLEGWPFELALSGSIMAEMKASLFNDKVIIGAGRIKREIAGMDNGSSLVFNSSARPFFAGELQVNLLPFLKYTSLTGSLEYPNQDYLFSLVVDNGKTYSWYPDDTKGSNDDSYYFQNNFSLNMIELDLSWLHFDFGSSAVWPKRLELGYIFPLANYVEYQNHIGDCDNLGLFADLKLRKTNIGELWGSFFLDELNGINNNPISETRDMFAIQFGGKYVIPNMSLARISLRYTKVEPYCYTHHSINYVPSYSHYVAENYTNNGQCIGYYLDPNSDELKLTFDWQAKANLFVNANYQFIRHGAVYGSQQVPGSSLYSEMPVVGRDELKKYFLHDGAYNWMHIVSVSGNYKIKNLPFDLELWGTTGFVYSYYTMIDSSVYDREGKSPKVDFKTPYTKVDTEEYPTIYGGVLTIGAKVLF